MCYLIQPHNLISGFCSSVPGFVVDIALDSLAIAFPALFMENYYVFAREKKCDLRMLQDVTPAHKGLTPLGHQRLADGDASGNISCITLSFSTENLYFTNLFRAFSNSLYAKKTEKMKNRVLTTIIFTALIIGRCNSVSNK